MGRGGGEEGWMDGWMESRKHVRNRKNESTSYFICIIKYHIDNETEFINTVFIKINSSLSLQGFLMAMKIDPEKPEEKPQTA